MCLAIPMKVIEKTGNTGKVGSGTVTYDVNFTLFPDAEPGDFVLVHAGFVIERIDPEEASKTLELFNEMFEKEGQG
ncbi:MAG: HypC/HybG/HupF family hydrogenase formation chaperone [Spirochaetales bacterium]|nr:HypC/HybG/HupF family hydrogenase formation chaperone [Spirochaetales bacterium]